MVMVRSEESDLTRDGVRIARHAGIGPDLHLRTVRPDAGERQRHRHVDVGGKAGDGLARAAGKHAQWRLQSLHRQAAARRAAARRPGRPAACA